MKAKLRVCASCEWIFTGYNECPKCQFAHYGARYVYGEAAYRYKITQKPWKDKMMADYSYALQKEIHASSQFNPVKKLRLSVMGLRYE